MIRYKKYQVTGEDSPLKGLWYARPVIEETFDIEKLAKHMSNHNTPYSSGVIKGVLADMVSCTKELILDGKNVKLDDLAIFSVGIVSKKGAQSAADFSLANNVKGLKLRARATGELSNAQPGRTAEGGFPIHRRRKSPRWRRFRRKRRRPGRESVGMRIITSY